MRSRRGLTAWKFTVQTVICSINFCRTAPTNAPTTTAGRLKIAPGSCLEVTDAVISVWGAGRVGMHLAPRGDAHDMGDSNLAATFGYVARGIGPTQDCVPLRPRIARTKPARPGVKETIRRPLRGPTKPTPASAEQLLQTGEADAVAFGRHSSRIPISRSASPATHRSIHLIQTLSTQTARKAIPITRLWRNEKRPQQAFVEHADLPAQPGIKSRAHHERRSTGSERS